ncbi:MAG: hypothetical protein AAGU14_10840 [Eubacteriaceae bacterium]
MILNKYYKNFEGEPQINFVTQKKDEFNIWEGYFYILMEYMFDQGSNILSDFYSREDDDKPWEINDIKSLILQLESFDIKKIDLNEQTEIKEILPELINDIKNFLVKAFNTNQKVYIIID